jgi:hypothetical protein
MKVNNYLVTGANLATMGYRQKPGTTPPLDGSIMSKGEANTYYYIDGSVSPWSTYPDTRAPKYQDFPCPCVASVTVENTLAFGFSQTISYEDCSGNTYYFYLPYGQAAVFTGCTFISGDSGPIAGCGILRGSVVGARLSAINYGACCYSNYPCTTTSTTTLPQCNYDGLTVVCNTPSTATLDWSFNETFSSATMDIYVNGINVESRNATSSGTWTGLVAGDEIYVEIIAGGCTGLNIKANAYTDGIIVDAACDDNFVVLVTPYFIVQPGDLGTTLNLEMYALCSGGCV